MSQTENPAAPRCFMAGEALLVVEFGEDLTPAINDAALAFDQFLQTNPVKGVLESAPLSQSVALRFDPLMVSPADFRAAIMELAHGQDWGASRLHIARTGWKLPVCYGAEYGPDLAEIAQQLKQSVETVISAHCATVQRVQMIGFAPGFLYTGMLPEMFNLARRGSIHPEVAAGSVSVAIGQSVISSTVHPTGWHVIGRTPFKNFDPERQPPVLIRAGDEIRFFEIEPAQFTDWRVSSLDTLETFETGECK